MASPRHDVHQPARHHDHLADRQPLGEALRSFGGEGRRRYVGSLVSTHLPFGFLTGTLRCTSECRLDFSQCSGPDLADRDDDGFPATRDCDDNDPEINPGMAEILRNA